ncbi:polysaccharide pyruvyl transferase family protein [bacterium]|nr:polysaccharide pyruvyl transferase family protein [bacterium]
MKKVAILTFNNSINYGALLQAYALREFLNISGFEGNIINYQRRRSYSQVSFLRKIASFVWQNLLARFFANKKRKERTSNFRTEQMKLGQKCVNLDDLKQLNAIYNVFVVGSDQVWNPVNNRGDSAFFLSFVDDKNKRLSYAASFGSSKVDKSYLESNRRYLEKFDAISVREKESAEILKKELGITAETLIDPVFLRTKNDWVSRLNLNESADVKDKYVLCYVMPGHDDLVNKIYSVAKSIADRDNLKIITLGKKDYAKPMGIETLDKDAGPIEFLQYILNAEYVVTNSFHGTALSIVFRKQFFTVLKKGIGLNLRLENLLQSISLTSRLIYMDSCETGDLPEAIDYTKSEPELNLKIENSKRFLIDAIGR